MDKNNKISKKQAEKVLSERDPYVGIVLEDINENLKTLLDGHEIMQGRMDRLDTRMGRVEFRLEKVEIRLENVEGRLGRVEVRLENVEIDLKEVGLDVKSLKNRMTDVEAAIAS